MDTDNSQPGPQNTYSAFDIPVANRTQQDLEKIMQIVKNFQFLTNISDEQSSTRIQ